MFIIDMSFHSVIMDYFKKLDISLVVIKSMESLTEKDLPKMQTTHYYEKDIVFEAKGIIDNTGTIELGREYTFIFDEKLRRNEGDVYIKKCPSLIFLWKVITPDKHNVYYTYKKVLKVKDDILVLKKNLT